MYIYIINIFLIPVYAFLLNQKKDRRLLTIIITIQLFLILALRDVSVGADLTNYCGGYEYINSLSFGEMISRLRVFSTAVLKWPFVYESGFVLINWVIGHLGLSFHGFLVVVAAFTAVSIGVFIYRYSQDINISFVLFIGLGMYAYSFGILRQTIAVCIFLWAFPLLLKKKYLLFIAVCIAAFTVHRSGIIFIFALLYDSIRISKKGVVTYLSFCCVFAILSPLIYRHIIDRIVVFLGKGVYLSEGFKPNYQIIIMVIIPVLIVCVNDFKVYESGANKLVFFLYLLSIPLEILGMSNEGFARIIEYYYIYSIILIPLAINSYGTKHCSMRKTIICDNSDRMIVINFTRVILFVLMLWFMIHNTIETALNPYAIYSFVI